jgi:hypothetical protein
MIKKLTSGVDILMTTGFVEEKGRTKYANISWTSANPTVSAVVL